MTTPAVAPALYEQAAHRLRQAAATRTPCPPIRDLLTEQRLELGLPGEIAFGYGVQRRLTEASTAEGRRIVGSKIGLTSEAVQRQLKVDQPDFGVLFADMARDEAQPIDVGELLQPRIEAEVAFTLGADLDGEELDLDVVRGAVRTAVAALEIVDSRIADWDIRLVDTIADNASCGLYVLGADPRPLAGLDLPAARMRMTAGGDVVSEGSGAACLGDPLEALLWLARVARGNGVPLRAGDVVLSGALGPMVPVWPGTTYTAEIDGLGSVRASFGGAS
jgi:2-keto-4-pentenoate hydratase